MIVRTKVQSWHDFVTKEGNREPWVIAYRTVTREPWGIAYRTVTRELRGEETTSTLRTPQGDTSNWQTTATAMLSALLPDDQEESETPEQRGIKRSSTNPPNVENIPRVPIRGTQWCCETAEEGEMSWPRLDRGKNNPTSLRRNTPGAPKAHERLPRLGDLP